MLKKLAPHDSNSERCALRRKTHLCKKDARIKGALMHTASSLMPKVGNHCGGANYAAPPWKIKILSQNIRGLRSSWTFKALNELIVTEGPK